MSRVRPRTGPCTAKDGEPSKRRVCCPSNPLGPINNAYAQVVPPATPNTSDPGTADVVWQFFPSTVTTSGAAASTASSLWLTPVYQNPPPGWGGTTTAVAGFPLRWLTTQVPWNAQVNMYVAPVSAPSGGTYVSLVVPPPACTGSSVAVTDQSDLGATCVTLEVTVTDADGFLWELLGPDGTAVQTGAFSESASVPINDLVPNTAYVFQATAACTGGTGVTALWPFVTMPQPYLGPAYTITDVTNNDDDTCDVTFQYINHYCAVAIQGELVDAPIGVGLVVVSATPPLAWRITGAPYSTSIAIGLQAEVGDCPCPGSPYAPGGALARTLTVTTPAEPAGDCSSLSVDGLDAQVVGASCATFAWIPNPSFQGGYVYTLMNGDTEVATGTVPNFHDSTVTMQGLAPATSYVFAVQGACTTADNPPLSPPSVVSIVTTAASTPALPAFTQTSANPTFTATGTGVYTATLTYPGGTCVGQPVLKWGATGPPVAGATIVPVNATTWSVQGLPASGTPSLPGPGGTVYLEFVATTATTGCTSGCATQDSPATLTTPVAIVMPAATSPCTGKGVTAQFVASSSGATCVTFSFAPTPAGYQFSGGYQYVLTSPPGDGGATVRSGTTFSTSSMITFAGLTPSTAYQFSIRGVCNSVSFTADAVATGSTLTAMTPVLPAPASVQAMDVSYSYNADDSATVTLTYPPHLAVCVGNVALGFAPSPGPPDPGIVITPVSATATSWHLANVPVPSTLVLQVTGTTLGAGSGGCTSGCAGTGGTLLTTLLPQVDVPVKPDPPDTGAPFSLVLTHYAGPPARLVSAGQDLEGSSADAPALAGAGTLSDIGSYLNQASLNGTYAANVVQRFVKYHLQRKITVGADSFYLPLTAIYYGNVIDPYVQGACVPTEAPPGTWKAFLPYNYADSTSSINSGVANFQYPPFLAFYVAMMQYNWSAEKGAYVNPARVQLGSNNYGSKQAGQQWYFNATIDGDTGVVTTAAPSDPKALNSVVDGIPDDGGNDTAGWNCMERWFMHAAYCNQQLRRIIDSGSIVSEGAGAEVMTLDDLTDDNAMYYQISAITTDAEGNGFPNTLYPDDSSATSAGCNYTIKCLWNKWLNQATELAPAPGGNAPPFWDTDAAGYLVAPQSRAVMPATPFTLPCAVSMTTPGLVKGMSVGDVGSPDFDAVNAVFHEIYDTSDSKPYYFLGASVHPATGCGSSGSGSSVSGVPFSAAVQTAANPTSATDQYAQFPEQYSGSHGTWDNLVLTDDSCTGALVVGSGGSLESSPTTSGSQTAFNNSDLPMSPLMNTATYTPWKNATSATPWILQKENPPSVNTACLGWALEASRYDLANGQWAAAAAAAGGPSAPINYSSVKQGVHGADGAMLWNDLSTGLKPRVANIMGGVVTPAAARGQVWMLSNQCGPWVNFKGVRASSRTEEPPYSTAEYLTFTCPDAAMAGEYWPGWQGMAGQWWGPGTSATAGVLQNWSLDQESLGPYDPVPGAAPKVPTGSTEDNFGVFEDFGVQVAAWAAMARDLSGSGLNPHGISNSAGIKYTPSTTGVPVMGCYELGFMPLSWMGPPVAPP
jgi:hypothetical protein